MKDKKGQLNSMFLYFMLYVPLGAVCPLLSQYLDSIGFSGTQVGIVTSCSTGAAVLGGLFMGKVYANASRKRMVIAIMFLICAVGSMASLSAKTFLLFTFVYSGLYLFQEPVHGVCDSMMIQNNRDFGIVRACGAIGYAVASYVSGILAESAGLQTGFYIHAAAYLIAILVVFREKEPPHYNTKEEKINISELFKEKKFILLLVCAFFITGPTMANNTYFSYLYRAGGGDIKGIGLAFLLMCLAEAVCMSLLTFVKRVLPTEKIIPVGIVVAVIRFGLYAFGPSYKVLLGTFFLQGIMNGIILVEVVKYFEKIVSPRLANISVSAYYALGNNLSAIACNLLGGVILDAWNINAVFIAFTLFNVFGLVCYFILGFAKVNNRR